MLLSHGAAIRLLLPVALLGFLPTSRSALHAQGGAASPLPSGEGRELVATVCTQCHALTPIVQMRDGVAGWKNMVEEMVLRGAQLSAGEADTVARYLAQHFGPGTKPFTTGTVPPRSALSSEPVKVIVLPGGAGKELVEARCGICHDLGRVVTARRSREEWEQITKNMLERGPTASPEQTRAIVSYLSSQFGK